MRCTNRKRPPKIKRTPPKENGNQQGHICIKITVLRQKSSQTRCLRGYFFVHMNKNMIPHPYGISIWLNFDRFTEIFSSDKNIYYKMRSLNLQLRILLLIQEKYDIIKIIIKNSKIVDHSKQYYNVEEVCLSLFGQRSAKRSYYCSRIF